MSSRIWDNYFFYGEFYILKTALAIFAAIESKTSPDSFESIVLLIKQVKGFVDEETLFKTIENLKLTKQSYIKIKK
jgi:hypothetical protein